MKTRHIALGSLLSACAAVWAGHAAGQSVNTPDRSVPAIARAIKDSNKVYLGWRVFESSCARCHGEDASGVGGKGPDLLARVRPMHREKFMRVVLQRYRWVLPSGEAAPESGTPDTLIEGVTRGQRGELTMPAWGNEPPVKAHLTDLYDYLQARSTGDLGPGRPPWAAR